MVHGTGSTSITAASPEWIPLSSVYRYVLALSPSPEFAKIAISTAWENNQLRLRAEVREREDRPRLSLGPGEKASEILPKCTPDQSIAWQNFDNFDWERSYATRRVVKSHFEYVAIVVNRDDVLKVWPPVETTLQTETLRTNKSPPVRPEDVSDLVWVVAGMLDDLKKEDPRKFDAYTQKQSVNRVKERLGRNVSVRTLQKAVAARRQKDGRR
jgi:hypothetical protein